MDPSNGLSPSRLVTSTQIIRAIDFSLPDSGDRADDALLVKNLTKMFKKHRAVNDLSFGVPHGQCFGLLGVNGAGKTTTFRMLTGIMDSSGGDAIILGNRYYSHCRYLNLLIECVGVKCPPSP